VVSEPRRYSSVGPGVPLCLSAGLEIFSKLLAGMRDVDAEVVVTLGRDLDPAVFRAAARLRPPRTVLAARDAHGALHSRAVPRRLRYPWPRTRARPADDHPPARRRPARERRALRQTRRVTSLNEDNLTPEHVRDVALDVLHNPTYRRSAERLRDEFERLPGQEFTVELLERLARDKVPIIASR
jgi:hypothetical protein